MWKGIGHGYRKRSLGNDRQVTTSRSLALKPTSPTIPKIPEVIRIRNKIITPKHPRWNEFIDRLESPEGCDFKEKEPGNPKSLTWECKGFQNKDFAKAILQKMPEIDVEASLRYFESKGGYCDCEILFNVG